MEEIEHHADYVYMIPQILQAHDSIHGTAKGTDSIAFGPR
jgi:hypothetical protein